MRTVSLVLFLCAFLAYLASGVLVLTLTQAVGGGVLALVCLYALLRPTAPRLPVLPALLLLVVWPLFLITSVAFSQVVFLSLTALPLMLALPMAVYVLASVFETQERALRVLDGTAILMALYGVFLTALFLWAPDRFSYTVKYPSIVAHVPACLLSMLFPYAMWRFVYGRKIWLFVCGGLFAGVLATSCQVPWLACLVAYACVCVLTLVDTKGRGWRRPAVLAALIGALSVGADLLSSGFLMYQFTQRNLRVDTGFRIDIWRGAFDTGMDRPLTGSGLGTFAQAFASHRYELDRSAGLSAHNDLLQLFAETGAFGPVLLLGILSVFAFWVVRYWGRQGHAQTLRSGILPIALGIGVMMGIGLFSNVFYDPACLMMMGVFLAALLVVLGAEDAAANNRETLRHYGRQIAAAFVVIVLLPLSVLGPALWVQANDFALALSQNSVRRAGEALDRVQAITLGLAPQPFVQRAGLANMLLSSGQGVADPMRPVLFQIVERNANEAAKRNALSGDPLYQKALALQADNKPQESAALLEQVLEKDHTHVLARLGLYEYYKSVNEGEKAYELLRAARFWTSWKYDTWPLYDRLLQEAWARGDWPTVRDTLVVGAAYLDNGGNKQ